MKNILRIYWWEYFLTLPLGAYNAYELFPYLEAPYTDIGAQLSFMVLGAGIQLFVWIFISRTVWSIVKFCDDRTVGTLSQTAAFAYLLLTLGVNIELSMNIAYWSNAPTWLANRTLIGWLAPQEIVTGVMFLGLWTIKSFRRYFFPR